MADNAEYLELMFTAQGGVMAERAQILAKYFC